jgi:hypothetical protein
MRCHFQIKTPGQHCSPGFTPLHCLDACFAVFALQRLQDFPELPCFRGLFCEVFKD